MVTVRVEASIASMTPVSVLISELIVLVCAMAVRAIDATTNAATIPPLSYDMRPPNDSLALIGEVDGRWSRSPERAPRGCAERVPRPEWVDSRIFIEDFKPCCGCARTTGAVPPDMMEARELITVRNQGRRSA